MPYPVMNTLLDAGYPDGRAQLLALELHDGLTDGLIDTSPSASRPCRRR